MSNVMALVCKECGKSYEAKALHVCEFCFGPLEVRYDYDAIASKVSHESIAAGPNNMWRYRELLPVH